MRKTLTLCITILALIAGMLLPLQAQFTGQKICIDPGHGGSDPGATGYGITEKWANLDISLRARDLFVASGANVYMTRTTDVARSLSYRVNYANNNGVHRFMSVHNNAFNGSAHGTETFCYTYGSSNSFDLRNKVNPKIVEYMGTHNRGVKTANFYVIRYTNMPAILTESAFIDNYDDNQKLKSAHYRQQSARGHLHGAQWHYGLPQGDPGEPWDAAYNAQSYQATMMAGTTAVVWIEFKNTGTQQWRRWGDNPVRLGTWNPQDRSSPFFTQDNWIGANRPSDMDQSSVDPNNVARFTFIMTAPSTPGTYTESFRIVREGSHWFGPSRTFTIEVTPATGNISGTIRNANSSNPIPGATVSLNTGPTTQTNASGVYSIGNLDAGGYTVTASAPGYASNSGSATVTAGQTTTRNLNLTPTDTEPPTTPTNLSATAVSSTRINLSWTASTDNVGVAGYKVYRGGSLVGTSSTNSYSDLGLSPNTTYTYRVRAYDLAENESGLSAQASASTFPTTVAVFQEGFPNMDQWVADVVANGSVRGAVWDPNRNIGRFHGGGSARTQVGSDGLQGSWSYRDFPRPFAAGTYEGYFYDTSTHNNSRQGMHLRGYTDTGTLAFSFYIGTYPASPGAFNKYSVGVYALGEGGWTWHGAVHDRKEGWNRFVIEVLPYTGSNDLKFYIGDSVSKTLVVSTNRPASTNSWGISRTYVGHNYNVNHQGWYDDIGFYAEPPLPPAIGNPQAQSETSIRWNYADNSNNEAGFDLFDSSQNLKGTTGMNTNRIIETGLQANTSYTRYVAAYNGTLHSVPSQTRTAYTLSVPPSASTVNCDRNANTWYGTANFTFQAVNGFGAGRVEYYRYAWTQSSSHTWTGSEPIWNSGDLSVIATDGGNWYLHVRGYNGDDIANDTTSFGPYQYDSTPPSAPTVTDEGKYTGSTTNLSASWTGAEDPESGIVKYWYALGTSPGNADIIDWTETANSSVALGGLSLNVGETYFFAVRAENGVGLQGAVGMSDGIAVVQTLNSISEAKAMPDGALLALNGKAVTANLVYTFYIQSLNRVSGLKIEGDIAPNEGAIVMTAGQLETIDGERVLTDATVFVNGSTTVPAPLFMINRTMGGGQLNTHTLGITDGVGLNNIGLLITTTGRVTFVHESEDEHIDKSFFFIDDGSAILNSIGYTGIKVDPSMLTFMPLVDQYLKITGISSIEIDDNLKRNRVLIPRGDQDVVTQE